MGAIPRRQRAWLSAVRSGLLRITVVAIACQLIVPPGYMPAAIAAGSPLALCGSLPIPGLAIAEPSAALHSGHYDDHPAATNTDSEKPPQTHEWNACPLGALSATAATVSKPCFSFAAFRHEPPSFSARETQSCAAVLGFRSRAPPITRSRLNTLN